MFCVIPLLLLTSSALGLPTAEKPYYDLTEAEGHFAEFKQKYGKQYKTKEEHRTRFEIFKEHLVNINHLNANDAAVYAVNEFSDVSYEELKMTRSGLFPSMTEGDGELAKVQEEWIRDAPDSLDYRDQNLVTPAKNQKACLSCYAFAGVACIEGQHAMKHKELISLSEQQAVDCDYIDDHCLGAHNLVNVINEIAKQGGIEREEDYPYEARNGTCRTNRSKIAVKVTGGIEIDTSTDDLLTGALVHYGPLSVVLNSEGLPIDYKSGVITPEYCSETSLNHGVLLIGYGQEAKENGKKYWILKNSFGPSWGMEGFFYMEKGYCGLGSKFTACATVE